ncbi:OmpH family outer membrane protein [Candidatus Pelagibacter sp. HIMB1623]|uniref:OmpH family outer membrane protein n=1 Tax=unclassified Candidatus Pelagibacter TaxID=2647897 RepID=UPI003F83B873
MIKKNFYFNFIFLILFQSNLYAEIKIAYLDFDVVLSKIEKGKILFLDLKKKEEAKFKEFNSKEAKLKEEENKLKGSQNLISKEQLNISLNQFNKKIQNYREFKSNEIEKLKKDRKDEIFKLLDIINPIIQEYMAKNSISMLFDKKNIYIADKNYDITDDLIEIINKSFK